MTKKILMCVMVLAISITLVVGATTAYFSDKETNNGNTFTAGTLDLTIDGKSENKVLFEVDRIIPKNESYKGYTLKNIGNVDGYLNITKTTVVQDENGLTDPEKEAGDLTDNKGELGKFLQLYLYIDNDKDGYFSIGDEKIYRGTFNNMPRSFTFNKPIKAGKDIVIRSGVGFYENSNDNIAQSDKLTYGIEYVLSQNKVETAVTTVAPSV